MRRFFYVFGLVMLLHIFISQSLMASEGTKQNTAPNHNVPSNAFQEMKESVIGSVYVNQYVTGGPKWFVKNVQVYEGAKSAKLTLLRMDASVMQAVYYTTVDDTAIAPLDYVSNTGQVLFNPGEWEKMIEIAIVNDAVLGMEKQFWVVLSDTSGDFSSITVRASVVIMDNSPSKIRLFLLKVDDENYDVYVNVRNSKGMPLVNQTVIFNTTIGTLVSSAVTDEYGEANVRLNSKTSGSGILSASLSSGVTVKSNIYFDITPLSINTGSTDSEVKLTDIR
ncbi:Calx-beta domain-containing protein [Paenibacillus hodogayensis]|uniref:Calx-beta domain-containing protein n=1 Tax=Paenibacillus hodogayensis TaxID=279208 RepID=A0ABV5W8E5_9BACL